MKKVLILLLFSFFVLSLSNAAFSQNCEGIKMIQHKKTGVKVFESSDSNAVQFTKDMKGKMSVYRIHLRINLEKIDLGQKGVVIIFDDGTKLEKPDETVDVNNLDDKFEFTSTLTLLPEELILFQKKKISGFLLYIHQKNISVTEGEKYRDYAKCLSDKK